MRDCHDWINTKSATSHQTKSDLDVRKKDNGSGVGKLGEVGGLQSSTDSIGDKTDSNVESTNLFIVLFSQHFLTRRG